MRRPLCVHAGDAAGRSVPNRGAPRTCAKGRGENGTVYALADCCGCELHAAREPGAAPGDSAGPRPAPRVPFPCPHRSEAPTGAQGCHSCRGRVELKVFDCAVHGTCLIETAVAGRGCCKTCPDRPLAT